MVQNLNVQSDNNIHMWKDWILFIEGFHVKSIKHGPCNEYIKPKWILYQFIMPTLIQKNTSVSLDSLQLCLSHTDAQYK